MAAAFHPAAGGANGYASRDAALVPTVEAVNESHVTLRFGVSSGYFAVDDEVLLLSVAESVLH